MALLSIIKWIFGLFERLIPARVYRFIDVDGVKPQKPQVFSFDNKQAVFGTTKEDVVSVQLSRGTTWNTVQVETANHRYLLRFKPASPFSQAHLTRIIKGTNQTSYFIEA